MKIFIVVALCLSAVVADELHSRGVDFHTLHYSQHQQTLDEAKRQIADAYDGQHSEFEEVGSYGGLGGVGVGTVGLSSSSLSGAEYGSSAGSNAQFSSSAGANFGASHSANFASSASFDSNANSASSVYGSGSHHSGSQSVLSSGSGSGLLLQGSSYGSQHSGSQGFSPSSVGSSSGSYLESSSARNSQHFVPEINVIGGVDGYESSLHRSNNLAGVPLVYSSPSSGIENHYEHEERRVSNTPNPVYNVPLATGSDNVIHHEEHHERNQVHPSIQFYTPSGGSESHLHIKEKYVQHTPVQVFVSAPSESQESHLKYRKTILTASQVPAYVHQGSVASTAGTHLGQVHSNGFTGTNTIYKNGVYGASVNTVPSAGFGFSAGNSNSVLKTGYGTSTMGVGHQAGYGANAGYVDSSSFGSKFNSQSKFGSSFGTESKFGSHFGAESAFNSGTAFGASGSTTGLHGYMSEAERFAKAQVQGMSVGGTRASGSQFNSNLEGDSVSGIGGFTGLSGAGVGAGNAGYKTKSWEKASKWSSQSEFGPDGVVNNYKELSTGESENYDINGRRAGYKAATATLDDNGKVSSYSLHT